MRITSSCPRFAIPRGWTLLVLALLLPAFVAGAEQPANIQLIVDYGDGVQVHFKTILWQEGMTIIDALRAAQKHPHGVAFSSRGSGSTELVTQIGDLKNERGGKDSRNWLYWVNNKLGEVSAGGYALKASDVVHWKFTAFKPDETP